MFHHFPDEPEVGANCLVRSTDFEYSFEANPADARNPIYSFLLAATHAGYRRRDGGYQSQRDAGDRVPSTARPVVDDQIRDIDPESLRNLPYGVDDSGYRWIDLDGEGMPGILTDQAERWYFKRNESPATGTDDGLVAAAPAFGPLQVLTAQPSHARDQRRTTVAGSRRRRPTRSRRTGRRGRPGSTNARSKATGQNTRRSSRFPSSIGADPRP